MTKTEPRSAGSGGGRDKTTPTELLAPRWYLATMNDGLFIINTPPRPSKDDVWHDRPDGPTVVLNVTDLPQEKAQALVDAHNATTLSAREDGWQLVPVEPTDAMLLAMLDGEVADDYSLDAAHTQYTAMLSAASRGRCSRCDGLGRLTAHSVPCIQCNGSGEQSPKAPTAGEGRG